MDLGRRQLIIGAAAVVAALPFAGIALPKLYLWADGIHDDTEALDALVFRGSGAVELSPLAQEVVSVRDNILQITHGQFRISSLDLTDANTSAWDHVAVEHCWFNCIQPHLLDLPENGYLIHLGAGL